MQRKTPPSLKDLALFIQKQQVPPPSSGRTISSSFFLFGFDSEKVFWKLRLLFQTFA